MSDKRISQLVERVSIANNDVLPIVALNADTTNKVTISTIQDWMQTHLDHGVTSIGITIGSTGTDISVSGSPVTAAGNITINVPTSSAANRGLLSAADWTTFNNKVGTTRSISTTAPLQGGGDLSANRTLSITQAGVLGDGYLSSIDWNTFNNKQPALGYTPVNQTRQLTINGTSYDLSADRTWNVGTVTSIGVSMPSAFTVSNSPITGAGTISITGAGSVSQYIDGTGALRTFPTIIGEASNLVREVYNDSGATMTKGTVVYINGGQGNLPTIAKALATGDSTSAQTYGVVQNNISNMSNGFIVVIGDLYDMATNGFAVGTQLYLSSTVAGEFTSTKQYAPAHLVYVGIVTRSHPTQGVIAIKIQNGYEMDELHNVSARFASDGDILKYVSSTGQWTKTAGSTTNITEGTNLYYTDARARGAFSETVTGLDYNSSTGVLSTSAGYGIPTTASQTNWDAAYNDKINSAAVTGTTTKTLTLTQQDGGTITASWTDINTDAVSSVFGRTGAVVAVSGDYNTDLVTEGTTNVYFTNTRSRSSISLTTVGTSGSANYTQATGVLNIPAYTLVGLGGQPALNGTGFVKATGTTITYDNSTYLTTSAASLTYLPLAGGALTGALTSSSNAVFKYSGVYALKLDSASATEENDLRFAKNGVDFGAIQTSGSTGDFELYVNTDGTSGGWTKMINMLRNGSGTTFTGSISAGNLSGTNTGDQTLSGLGGVPTSRTLTINGTAFDLSANRSWTIAAGVSGSGTLNKVAKFTSTGSAIGDSIITATDDDVKITSSLVGPMFVLEQLTASAYSQMQFKGDNKHAYIFKGNSTYTSYGGANALNFYTDSGAGGFAFYPQGTIGVFMDADGNLGVGAGTTLSSRLDIVGGNAKITSNQNGFGGINTINPSAGTSAYSGLLVGNNGATTAGGYLVLGGNYPTSGRYTSDGVYMFSNRVGGLTIAAEQTDSSIKFVTGTTIKGTMIANGNLGLNETAPTNLLHLAGSSATPSLRLASVSAGFWYDIGRENQTTGDFLINGTYAGTSNGTLLRIHQTNFTLTTAGTINAKGASSLASMAGTAFIGTGEFLSTGTNAGYFWENRSGGVTSSSNWYGWYTSAGIVRLYNGGADILQINGTNGSTRIYGNLGVGRDAAVPFDVYASTGGALTYMQNTNTVGYSGIDIFRQNGTHAGSVWCANDTAGATNNRNALTIAARTANEKVIIVGGGYDPTVTGGLTVAGSQARLEGTNPHHLVVATLGDYAYLHLQNTSGGTARNSYFIQNRSASTANGVSAGASYMYFGEGQQMEFSWAGNSRIQFTSTGQATFAADVIAFSDISVKENIRTIDNALDRVVRSRGVLYDRKDTKVKDNIGFIAQELELEFPELISVNADGTKGVKYQNAVAVLFEAVKEQQKQINDLKKQVV